MGWVYLVIAGLLELGWPVSIKKAWQAGTLDYGWAAVALVCMLLSMGFLVLAQRTLPIGTAYAVWTGMGAVGTVILGVVFLKEPATVPRMLFLGLIVTGIVGLKFTSGE